MNKYTDSTLLRKNRIYLRVNDSELSLLRDYQNSIRAPGLSQAVVELLKTAAKQRLNSGSMEENKESSKENKEITLTLEKNAHTHARDLSFYLSWITDDESLRPLALEFLRGRLAAGEDLEQRGAAVLKQHFNRWLPKYQAKMEIAARQNNLLRDQNLAKSEREAKAKAMDAHEDQIRREANTPEAQAERARVCAKFGKPWKMKKGGVNNEMTRVSREKRELMKILEMLLLSYRHYKGIHKDNIDQEIEWLVEQIKNLD